ncbi:MAG: NAD(P)/FAD-dependent oxidoreductase, partial [Leptospira sp.]|nr:NAD(P)/FAD-dependent oxidoreductase [Leptospira sp.]
MWPKKFFQWLDGNSPKGEVEFYPILNEKYESNLPNVFIIGDLTGVPLLKLAVDSGVKVWKHIPINRSEFLDAVIIGAGPSGIACALEGKKLGKRIRVIESNLAFQTIQGYPKGKPIFAEPKDLQVESKLVISDGTKESLLESLNKILQKANLEISYGEKIAKIERRNGYYTVLTESGNSFQTNSIILAIGKSGNPNRLGIPGETLHSVFHRFIDPAETKNQDVVVCGGGDSALEAAIASASYAKSITIVYRKSEFSRAKSQNQDRLEGLIQSGKLKVCYNASVTEILEKKLFIKTETGSKKIPYDSFYILIGNEPPKSFLNNLGIRFQNDRKKEDFIGLGAMLSFAGLAYFGKASFYGPTWFGGLANLFAVASLALGLTWSFLKLKSSEFDIRWNWNVFRNIYLLFVFLYFCFVYFFATNNGVLFLGKYPSFHYTLLYSLTILVFGIRRMYIRKT